MFGLFKNKEKEYEEIDVSQFKALSKEQGAFILDVRNEMELKDGSIAGHTMISIMSLSFNSKIQELDKSKTYLVYCRSGARSGKACGIMSKQGFKVYNLKGGIIAWKASEISN